MEELQRRDGDKVHPDRWKPLGPRAGGWWSPSGQAAQQNRCHQIGHTDRKHGRLCSLVDYLPHTLQNQERKRHHDATG